MEEVFVRSPFNYDMHAASQESGLDCSIVVTEGEPVQRTKQSFAEEVDINTIVRRFNVTGELPTNIRMPTYGDFTGVSDFQTAMNAIARANEAFEAMPAEVRYRFGNDPQKFVEFCSDEKNADEAKKLGLVKEVVPEAEVLTAKSLVQAFKDASAPAQEARGATQEPGAQ